MSRNPVKPYQDQLDRFLDDYHVPATYQPMPAGVEFVFRLHVGKYKIDTLRGDTTQRDRTGIASATDFTAPPANGDRVHYLGETATIDLIDPRIEAGGVIGWDFMLRGD